MATTPSGAGSMPMGHVFSKAAAKTQPTGKSNAPEGKTLTKAGFEVDKYVQPKTAGILAGNKAAKAASIPKNRAPAGFKAKGIGAKPAKFTPPKK